MKMKTAHVVTCLALLTTACGTADFSVAVADSGTPDTDPMTVDVQTKPDADPMPKKTDADTPHHDAGMDTKAATPDSAVPTPDSGHAVDAGEDTSKADAGKPDPDSGVPDPDSGSDSGSKKDADADAAKDDGGHAVPDSGEDAPVTCAPTSCAGNTPQGICGGTIKSFPACSGAEGVCLNGACVACTPGGTECGAQLSNPNPNVGGTYATSIRTCDVTGHWSSAELCANAVPGTTACTGSGGAASCGGTCQPGSRQCGVVSTDPEQCPNGQNCTACPGATMPQTNGPFGIQDCNNAGNWDSAYDCNPGACQYVCQMVGGQGTCEACGNIGGQWTCQ